MRLFKLEKTPSLSLVLQGGKLKKNNNLYSVEAAVLRAQTTKAAVYIFLICCLYFLDLLFIL